MNANTILAALERRHSDAVFVPECKNGPTQTGSHRRLDAWVLLKTWSPVTTIGYEIKVDKGDWRRDEKIADYMGLCHQLYIVAPKGIVPVEELPAGVGLQECVGEQNRLVTRRKATRREINMPVSLMVYVLMCRVNVQREREEGRNWRLDALRKWSSEKDDRRQLHYSISRKIQDQFKKQEDEIERVTRRIQELEHVEKRIRELGYDPLLETSRWKVREKLSAIAGVIDPWLLTSLERAEDDLQSVRSSLGKLRDAATSVDAVDPSGGSEGTPSTRDKSSSRALLLTAGEQE